MAEQPEAAHYRSFHMAASVSGTSSDPSGSVGTLRNKVSLARADATEKEHMQNLAYVVSSANDNIQQLQRTIKQQERKLAASADHAAALQRNKRHCWKSNLGGN